MKRFVFNILFLTLFAVCSMAQFHVVANRELGSGYYPQFTADGTVITYSANENIANEAESSSAAVLRVDNADLCLNLYRNGVKTVLTPHGSDVNYVWSSLSPDGSMILFNTSKGTAICNLQGKEIVNLGNLNAPVWYGSRYVVGMDDNNNGNYYTSSSIVIASIDGKLRQQLTSATELGMYPAVNAEKGFVAYNTLDGKIKVMKISATELSSDNTKDIILVDAMPPIGKVDDEVEMPLYVRDPKSVKIYINAGHGGWDQDDRNVAIEPFAAGDKRGFWESEANLVKALMLDSLLSGLGFQTKLSRSDNGNESDRSLAAVAAEANAWGADFMLSIHSNSGSGKVNYILQLYAGADTNDETLYPTVSLCAKESEAVATLIAQNLYGNEITSWSSGSVVAGDKSYARQNLGWPDGYGVLRALSVPGCISEGSMHDYIPETYRLMNRDYLYLESWNFAKAISAYFCNKGMSDGIVAGQVRDRYNKDLGDYWKFRISRDELLAVNGAHVELLQDGEVVASTVTDRLNNGVFVFKDVKSGEYMLRVSADGYYTLEQGVSVAGNEITYQDMMLNLVRKEQPVVLSYSPMVSGGDSVEIFEPIVIEFSVDMLADSVYSAFSIEPQVDGKLLMTESQHKLIFVPSSGYDVATEYRVRLSTSACHPDVNNPNHLAETLEFGFVTKRRSNLNLVMHFPNNESGKNIASNHVPFVLVFDQEVSRSVLAENMFITGETKEFMLAIDSTDITIDNSIAPYCAAYFEVNDSPVLMPGDCYKLVLESSLTDVHNLSLGEDVEVEFCTIECGVVLPCVELLNSMDEIFVSASEDKSHALEYVDITLSEQRTEGRYSNEISYRFADDEDEMLFLVPAYLNYVFTSKDVMQLDVYGDFSFNQLYAEFSVDGDVHELLLCDMDFLGWNEIVLPLSSLPEGIPYQFTGLRLVRTDNILSQSGVFRIDRLSRLMCGDDSAVDNMFEQSVVVSPNPVTDMINVTGVGDECELQLFTVDGKLLRQVRGSEMSATGLSPTTYILRVSTPEGVAIKQILKY